METIIYWIQVSVRVLCILICCKIVDKEMKTQSDIQYNTYEKWLNIWSLSAMILVIITLTLSSLHRIELICKYIVPFNSFLYMMVKIFVTFYQITRLQCCFSSYQIHSRNIGYSKICFIFLFVYGFALSLLVASISILRIFITKWIFIHDNCSVIGYYYQDILIPIGWGLYILWDWIVLICYMIKIFQFYKKRGNDIPENALKIVKFILQKIVFLTFILEISACTVAALSDIYDNKIIMNIGTISGIIDVLITVYILYLMRDHNHKQYIKFVKMLDNMKLFICCKSFVDNALSINMKRYIASKSMSTENEVTDRYDTKSEPLPQPIAMETSIQNSGAQSVYEEQHNEEEK